MKTVYPLIILSVGYMLIACQEEKVDSQKDFEVIQINSSSEEELPEPPPPNYRSKFETLEIWLSYICENEHPGKSISTYLFDLFQEGNKYTLCLTGIKTNRVSEDHIESTIEFAPADMYFLLPEKEYKELTRAQVEERISYHLRAFAKTKKFKQSFLNEAKSVTTNWNGKQISDW
jgi:hypothetical protein